MLSSIIKKNSGFTLIEIMIALMLGLMVIGATISIYITTVKSGSDTIKSTRLNHDLESIMNVMVNDIRRAGFWAGAIAEADSRVNPFTSETTDQTNIQIRNLANPTDTVTYGDAGDCILYTYDANPVPIPNGIVDSNEYYGFRRNGTSIEMRISGTASATADCTNGSWQPAVANNEITISKLEFTESYQCLNTETGNAYSAPCLTLNTTTELPGGVDAAETRSIIIEIEGNVAGDTSVRKTLTNTIKLRNDRVFTR